MKHFAHYVFLAFTVYGGVAYWFITTGDSFSRRDIDHGYLGIIEPAKGFLAFMLHPGFSYAVLLMAFALVAKEFFVRGLGRRFALNAGGFAVVCLFIGLFQYWVHTRI